MSKFCPNLPALQAARASLKQPQAVDLASSLNLYKETLEVMPAPVPATEQEKTVAVRIVQQLYLHYVAHVRPKGSPQELESFAKVVAQIMDSALLFADLNEVGDEQEWGKRFHDLDFVLRAFNRFPETAAAFSKAYLEPVDDAPMSESLPEYIEYLESLGDEE